VLRVLRSIREPLSVLLLLRRFVRFPAPSFSSLRLHTAPSPSPPPPPPPCAPLCNPSGFLAAVPLGPASLAPERGDPLSNDAP